MSDRSIAVVGFGRPYGAGVSVLIVFPGFRPPPLATDSALGYFRTAPPGPEARSRWGAGVGAVESQVSEARPGHPAVDFDERISHLWRFWYRSSYISFASGMYSPNTIHK